FVEPGFFLAFESVPPQSLDSDTGQVVIVGEVVFDEFTQDTTGGGLFNSFAIWNEVRDGDIYYAPTPVNRTGESIYAIINPAVDYGVTQIGTGLGCVCELPAQDDGFDIGYYSYDVTQESADLPDVAASQTGVLFRFFDDDTEAFSANGPFTLTTDTGEVIFNVGG
ncbi:MAG: hypothetical protein AAF517_23920, partial [Planctomycetota bacterium]